MSLKVCIFDLDGVITDTSKLQFQSWEQLAEKLGLQLSEKQFLKIQFQEQRESMDRIMRWANVRISEAEKHDLLTERNHKYLDSIDELKPEHVIPGFIEFNSQLRSAGIKTAVISSGKNVIRIIDKLDLVLEFDAIIDASMVDSSNLYENIFERIAERFSVETNEIAYVSRNNTSNAVAEAKGIKANYFDGIKSLKSNYPSEAQWSMEHLKSMFE
ncbi:HAD hydrolase-like protein [bacterium]|nr:HAD hydrolase-like protein [bacterium]